ncbi:Helicase domino [Fasciola hepatica]|uniref:Helicase domino n=1 Tax=Fasciola hepatica TaxID=6192 RepID=A0A4E0RZE7_FASHE|nr:Helicase domino [Fasciola hepatica]
MPEMEGRGEALLSDNLIGATARVREELASSIRARLDFIQRTYHEELVELSFIQSGALLIDFHGWRSRRSQELMQALCSGHLDPDDLSLISDYMSGRISADVFFPPGECATNPVVSEADADSENEERGLDEASIFRLALREVNVLKRVVELKKAGLWSVSEDIPGAPELALAESTPSMSSLAPPPENATRVFSDYLFAELRWLAEDFKRERQWKKSSAKKLALAAIKAYREKTERSLRAEREEAVRVRKLCASIARMVRDWWRQIDKIVHAKQQARLTVKRQQAMTTHLGRVLETTEEYTRWLTEGIAGAANATISTATTGGPASDSAIDMLDSKVHSIQPNNSPLNAGLDSNRCRDGNPKQRQKPGTGTASSDSEFTADEETLAAAEDDEETIAREEEEARNGVGDPEVSTEAELAQLAADADCPIEDLIPAGYLEACLADSYKPEEKPVNHKLDVDGKSAVDSSQPYKASANEEQSENESPVYSQERHERRLKYTQFTEKPSDSPLSHKVPLDQEEEIAQLQREAEIPLEALLEQFANQSESPMEDDAERSDSELTSSTQGSDTTTSSGEESDDDRTTLTDASSDSKSRDASLRELLSEDADNPPDTMNNLSTTDVAHPMISEPNEAPKLSGDASHNEAEKNLETLTAEALQAQPTSNTLTSNDAKVSVPFLLTGGSLREYQLVGLTWLAAIFQKRLNGILADEMGLGKTIQTIALLAYLACEQGIWGPHLIVVPTSVILNWEIEFKRWCPGFKILTYFGHAKERRERRKGWTKTNAFHVCITSYRLAIQDAAVFKRKKWKYLILDEAQNIKNFKSQRWQTLLTFNSQRRLLLTGTPLQNSLMELWSLMHFLMPNIFQSHRDFQEWFASPLTGMIEGNSEYNEQLVARLHKVLRPFLLRRLKADVERQMPKKFEHILMCRLSRRQRFLYDDFMSLTSTRETLKSGQFLSVMNVLMQLRKVCNHPNLFETRPIISSFRVADHLLQWDLPRLIAEISHPFLVFASAANGASGLLGGATAFTEPSLDWLDRAGAAARLLGQINNLAEMARDLPTFVARRCHNLCADAKWIQVIDTLGVVDDVEGHRKSLFGLTKTKKLEMNQLHRKTPLFPKGVVKEVQEELMQHFNHGVVAPPVRSCNSGMPKSVLRSRTVERQCRLTFMARINERRCDIADYTGHCAGRESNQYGTRIGPDVVHLITQMVRSPSSSAIGNQYGQSTYSGLTEGWSQCCRSLSAWPSRSHVCNRRIQPSRIEQAACIPSDTSGNLCSQHRFVKEAPWSKYRSWDQDSVTLRMVLSSPEDHIDSLSIILQRFVFFVPAAISSGFRISLSSARYQSQWNQQEERLTRFLQSECLPPVCVPQELWASRSVGGTRAPFDHVPLSPIAWLLPVQLHRISTACRIQFPDPRLIQYDCGKLQRLDLLLRDLKSGNHRVLIFTQMARMLDILEQFLAYHGHHYLRLDGSTKVEQRQVLMERFNQDSSIFVFILSTRSGGLGVNLTGADTVIFYDSDWNPTMDAQAQDRCHRIGQTRDVHIYRLISELTVEENILRKANQKRFLSDVAIEGGRFTTAFFKQNTINELFAEPSGLEDLVIERQKQESMRASRDSELISIPMAAENLESAPVPVLVTRSGRHVKPRGDAATIAALAPPPPVVTPVIEEKQLAALLETCEDENDRIAAKRAIDEAQAELAEFDETIPLADQTKARTDNGSIPDTPSELGAAEEPDPLTQYALKKQKCRAQNSTIDTTVIDPQTPEEESAEQIVERELAEFEAALRPIERFGIRNLEEQREDMLNEELEQAEAQLSESKETWRLDQLKALHVADEERAAMEEDEMLYCYGNYDPQAQVAELERLERLIAEEEQQALSSEPTRPRGRLSFSDKSSLTTKSGTKRSYGVNKSIRRTDTSGTEPFADEDFADDRFVPSKRGAGVTWDTQPNFVDSSDSDDRLPKVVSDVGPAFRRLTKARRPDEPRTIQHWEEQEFSSDGFPSEEEEEDWGAQISRRLENVKQRDKVNKRKRPSISFFRPNKIPKVDSVLRSPATVQNRSALRIESDPGMLRRDRVCAEDGSMRTNVVTVSVPVDVSPQPSSCPLVRSPMKQFVVKELGLPERGQMAVEPTSRPNTVPMETVSASSRSPMDRSVFDVLGAHRIQNRAHWSTSGTVNALPSPRGSRSGSSVQSSPQRPQHLDTSRIDGLLQSSHNQSPHSRPVMLKAPIPQQSITSNSGPSSVAVPRTTSDDCMIPVPRVSTVYTRKPLPASAQTPPEPVIPVQSVFNGTRESIPAGQLFTPTGQPVFVITRQMKTASGEVFQQRFTHPVIPPPQFVRVVNRLSQPTPSMVIPVSHSPSVPVRTTTTSPLGTPTGRVFPLNSTPTTKGNLFIPVQLLNERDTSPQLIGTVGAAAPIDLNSSAPSSTRIVSVTSTNSNAIPIIRRINCQITSPTPVLRLVNAEPHQAPIAVRPSFTPTVPQVAPVVRPSVMTGLRLVQSQPGPRYVPTQLVRARFLSPSDR